MDGASVTLRNQLELLREIARQQAEDIDVMGAECKWLDDSLRRRLTASSPLQASPGKPEIDVLLGKVKTEVDRLQCELGVWRGAPWDSSALVRSSDQALERQEEATHEVECKRWQDEKSILERQLRESQDRVRQLETAKTSGASRGSGAAVELADLASAQAEAGYFRDELAAERSAASTAQQRLASARLELEEERRSQARLAAQGEQGLAATLQEIGLTERRIEVETELQRAQQAQLQSVESTVATIKVQVQRAQHEAGELRASLEQNQETLRRLRR